MMRKVLSLAAALMLALPMGAQAAKATNSPTPAPIEISEHVIDEVPEEIQRVLDIAWQEYEAAQGKTFSNLNKYTEWRGRGVKFKWCGGYVTWCFIEAGIPMAELEQIPEGEVEGVHHVKEASVGKLLRGYQKMYRSTRIPQKGFLVVYGAQSYNRTVHVGLVYDVEELGEGRYRITTLEGNMSNTIRMYVHDYDMNAAKESKNLTSPPEEERTQAETKNFSYKVAKSGDNTFWINCFLMPYVPGDMALTADPRTTEAPTDSAEALPEESPLPSPTPTPAGSVRERHD